MELKISDFCQVGYRTYTCRIWCSRSWGHGWGHTACISRLQAPPPRNTWQSDLDNNNIKAAFKHKCVSPWLFDQISNPKFHQSKAFSSALSSFMSVLQEKLRRLLIKSIDTFSLDPPFSLYISSLPLVGHETQKSISNISNVAKVFLQSYLFQVFTLTKVFVLWYDVTIEERSNLFFFILYHTCHHWAFSETW